MQCGLSWHLPTSLEDIFNFILGGQTLCLEPSGWLTEAIMVLGDLRASSPPPCSSAFAKTFAMCPSTHLEVQVPGLLQGSSACCIWHQIP